MKELWFKNKNYDLVKSESWMIFMYVSMFSFSLIIFCYWKICKSQLHKILNWISNARHGCSNVIPFDFLCHMHTAILVQITYRQINHDGSVRTARFTVTHTFKLNDLHFIAGIPSWCFRLFFLLHRLSLMEGIGIHFQKCTTQFGQSFDSQNAWNIQNDAMFMTVFMPLVSRHKKNRK